MVPCLLLPPASASSSTPAAFAGTTVIQGDQSAWADVVLAEDAVLNNVGWNVPEFEVEGAEDVAIGFAMEPVNTLPGEEVIGIRLPRGYGQDGGVDVVGHLPEKDAPVKLEAGTYRVFILTPTGTPARVTLNLQGLDGTATVTPTIPSRFIAEELEPKLPEPANSFYTVVGTEHDLPDGRWEMGTFVVRGDLGSAFVGKICAYFQGTTLGEPAYYAPVCLPRDLGGRSGSAGGYPFVVFTGDGGWARPSWSGYHHGPQSGFTVSVTRAGRIQELRILHLIVEMPRGAAADVQ